MKITTAVAMGCASLLMLASTAANAAVSFVGYQSAPNAGETLVTTFEGGPTLAGVSFLKAGYSLSGDAALFTGSQSNVSAAPALAAGVKDTTQYLSVQRGRTATLDTPLLRAISFYVGSLDGFNSFTFHLANGATQLFTGNLLDALPFTDANGDQTGFTTNGRLTFSFDSAIDSVVFSSANNSLEISNIAALSAVPEPDAWAMLILGFAGVGAMIRRRRPSHGPVLA